MAVTTTTQMDQSVVTAYETDYIKAFMERKVWANLAWEKMLRNKQVGGGNISRGLKGQTIQTPVYEPLTVPTASLTETLDVMPQAFADSSVSVTIAEEGDVVQTTRLLNIVSYVDLDKPIAEAIGEAMSKRVDRIIRDAIVFNATNTVYAGTATSRDGLDTTSDTITYAKIVEAITMAETMNVPSFPDGSYCTIVHPAIMTEIVALNEWKNVAYYSDPTLIATGELSVLAEGGRFQGEEGKLYKLRFIPHPYGKLFLGAGTAAQAATTSTAAVAAGDITISVTDATGLAAGNWITVGTLESSSTHYPTTEQVLITSVSGSDLTIRGAGNAFGNWGFKFAHVNGSSVVEAPNVAALPIMGPESFVVAYASDVGQEGEVALEWAPSNIPRRFFNHSWYWVGGASIVDKHVVMLEAATAGHAYGEN